MKVKEYTIGGKHYVQAPLGPRQLRLLYPVLMSMKLDSITCLAESVPALDKLHLLFGIVLIEVGTVGFDPLAEESLLSRAEHLKW